MVYRDASAWPGPAEPRPRSVDRSKRNTKITSATGRPSASLRSDRQKRATTHTDNPTIRIPQPTASQRSAGEARVNPPSSTRKYWTALNGCLIAQPAPPVAGAEVEADEVHDRGDNADHDPHDEPPAALRTTVTPDEQGDRRPQQETIEQRSAATTAATAATANAAHPDDRQTTYIARAKRASIKNRGICTFHSALCHCTIENMKKATGAYR